MRNRPDTELVFLARGGSTEAAGALFDRYWILAWRAAYAITADRALADKTKLSAGYLNHLVHGNRPVPSNDVVETLAGALGVEPEHFREYRLRVITDKLEAMPELIDRLYKRLS